MNFQIDGIYSFEVYPTAIIGTNFKNVKVEGVINQSMAEALGFDTKALHAAVYPSLPSSTVNDPSKYNYLKIKTPSGQTQILGLPWINMNTVQQINLGKFIIEIDNESSSSQQKILTTLAANGYKVTSIVFDQAQVS